MPGDIYQTHRVALDLFPFDLGKILIFRGEFPVDLCDLKGLGDLPIREQTRWGRDFGWSVEHQIVILSVAEIGKMDQSRVRGNEADGSLAQAVLQIMHDKGGIFGIIEVNPRLSTGHFKLYMDPRVVGDFRNSRESLSAVELPAR